MKGNNNKTKKQGVSTGLIRTILEKGVVDEGALPDHLLSEGSQVKKKRNDERYFSGLLETMLYQLQIEYLVRQAQLKYMEHEEFYKKLFRLEEKAIAFRNLLARYLEQERARFLLTQEQLLYFQTLQKNFNALFNAVRDKAAGYISDINRMREEIIGMRLTLAPIREQYSETFRKCFAATANFVRLNPQSIQGSRDYPDGVHEAEPTKIRWGVEIDEDKFRRLGESIANRIRDENVSLGEINALIRDETRRFVRKELETGLADMPDRNQYVNQVMQSAEMSNFVQSVVTQIQSHIEQQQSYPELQRLAREFGKRENEISQRESTLEELEKKVEVLEKYREVLESMIDVNLKIVEEKRCNPEAGTEFIKASQDIIKEIISECDIPKNSIQFDESDPFSEIEEPRPSGPGLR